jgi:hypothetical protein
MEIVRFYLMGGAVLFSNGPHNCLCAFLKLRLLWNRRRFVNTPTVVALETLRTLLEKIKIDTSNLYY